MVSFLRRLSVVSFALALAMPAAVHAQSSALKPFKDELFAYPAVLASEGRRALDRR